VQIQRRARACVYKRAYCVHVCVCARAQIRRIMKPGGEVHWEPPRDLSFSLQTLVIFTAKVSGSKVPLRRKKSTGCPGMSPEIFQWLELLCGVHGAGAAKNCMWLPLAKNCMLLPRYGRIGGRRDGYKGGVWV